jgi:hypothetical protein
MSSAWLADMKLRLKKPAQPAQPAKPAQPAYYAAGWAALSSLEASSSAAPPASERSKLSTNPAGRASGSAVRPATRSEQVEQLEHASKRLKTQRAPGDSTKVSVTFIMCEDATSIFFLRPITDALEAGADMINIIFPFDPRDYHGGETYNPAWAPIMDLKRKLSPLFDLKWPGWGCSVEPTANVMSFYSNTLGNFIRKQVLDPLEASLPAVLLAFDTPAGSLRHRHSLFSSCDRSTTTVAERICESGFGIQRGEDSHWRRSSTSRLFSFRAEPGHQNGYAFHIL